MAQKLCLVNTIFTKSKYGYLFVFLWYNVGRERYIWHLLYLIQNTHLGVVVRNMVGVVHKKREIVQIAAIKVSDDLRVIGTLDILCKPVINPVLSDYFVNLTGITNSAIKSRGIKFQNAYKKFTKFVGDYPCLSHGFGGKWLDKCDGEIILENLKLYKMPMDSNIKYFNISAWLLPNYRKARLREYPKNSGHIAKALGVNEHIKKLGIDEHNALYDSYSILMGIKYFRKDIKSLLKNMK